MGRTIDEAIAHAKEKAEKNREAEAMFLCDDLIWNAKQERKLAEEHEQLADWLEELKALKSDDNLIFGDGLEQSYEEGYNKAIDDFYDKVLNFEDYIEPIDTSEFGAVLLYSGADITRMIYDIKKQLKAGGTIGNSTTDT